MKNEKNYSGYKSFRYLGEGPFSAYEISEEMGWGEVEPYLVPLSAEQKQRVEAILEQYPFISLHDHLINLPKNLNEMVAAIKEIRAETAYDALSKSCLDAVFDNQSMYFILGAYARGWKWDDCIFDMGMRMCDLAHQDFVIQCKRVDDILLAHRQGKIALIPCFEACTMIENELDRLDILFGLGVRMMGIVYSEANVLGSGLSEKNDGGLTNFGHQAVKRLNELGMAIDVSHCGDKTSMDVIEASTDPIFISHAGARGVWNSQRMKPDDIIIACAEKGGMIGIEAAPHTTFSDSSPNHDIDSFFDHFRYCVDLVGIDHVGFGPDTMYGDHSGLHDVLSKGLSMAAFIKKGETSLPHVDYVRGLENPTECSHNIVRYLVKEGYSDEEIGKVIGGNALRILREVWPS